MRDVTATRGDGREIDFATEGGTWFPVDVSPDGSWRVFDLLGHAYRAPTDGRSDALSLTQEAGAATSYHPRISPDVTTIAFVSDRGGQDDLRLVDAGGSDPRPVHDRPSGAREPLRGSVLIDSSAPRMHACSLRGSAWPPARPPRPDPALPVYASWALFAEGSGARVEETGMLRVPTVVQPSPIAGMGLFTAVDLAPGTVVWEYQEGVDSRLAPAVVAGFPEPYRSRVRHYLYLDESGLYVLCGDNARFMNHHPHPNCVDPEGPHTLAARWIRAGEELTCDYRSFDLESRTTADLFGWAAADGPGRNGVGD